MNTLLQNAWSSARAVIKEENEIANHRITALIAINSFSFVALGVALTCFVNDADTGYGRWGALFVVLIASVIGFSSAWSSSPTIRAAYRQIHATNDWWYRFQRSLTRANATTYSRRYPFPPITGRNARHWFIQIRKSRQKPNPRDGYRSQDQPVSLRFIPFLKLQKDDDYRDFELDRPTHPSGNHLLEQKGEPPQYGLAKWPSFLKWTWVIIFILALLFGGFLVWKQWFAGAAPPTGTANATISVSVEPNTKKAAISFQGDAERVKELMKQFEFVAGQ